MSWANRVLREFVTNGHLTPPGECQPNLVSSSDFAPCPPRFVQTLGDTGRIWTRFDQVLGNIFRFRPDLAGFGHVLPGFVQCCWALAEVGRTFFVLCVFFEFGRDAARFRPNLTPRPQICGDPSCIFLELNKRLLDVVAAGSRLWGTDPLP